MTTLKWTMRNGSWSQVPMILTHTPTGWKERPADKEDNENGTDSDKRKTG